MGHNGNAFYALRSCHQVLFGESGEFFSPDYLCSSPALWCNWTVQVPRGKRVQLYLEDLTPMYACHLKTDQIHLDESPVAAGESRILERCWGKARYTSITNTVHVVQLIGPNPSPPHRGFYGRFWAFGLPETFAETPAVSRTSVTEVMQEEEEMEIEETKDSSHEISTSKPPLPVEKVDSSLSKPLEVSHDINSWTNELAATTTGPWEKNFGEIRRTRGGAENQDGASPSALHHNEFAFMESVSMTTGAQGGITADEYKQFSPDGTNNASHTSAPTYMRTHAYTIAMTTSTSTSTTRVPTTEEANLVLTSPSTVSTATYKNEVTHTGDDPAGAKMESRPGMEEGDDALPVEMLLASSGGTFQTGAKERDGSYGETRPYSSMTPKPSHRLKGKAHPVQTVKNPPESPHLPGGLLLEVGMEIGLDHTQADGWDQIRNSFRGTVETMIQKELEDLTLRSVSLKRAKKYVCRLRMVYTEDGQLALEFEAPIHSPWIDTEFNLGVFVWLSAGALFIAWVQLGENDEVSRTLGVLHSTLQGLRGRSISPHNKSHGIVVSVSVEDIDECETQLVMCDVHADCVNEFGSYSCHCHHGYSPGLGGAVCVEAAGRECIRATVPMLLYIICFLLCFLLALLLVVLCVLYRRYHRGAFLPRCQHGSICSDTAVANDVNNNRWGRGHKSSASPIPPPPPSRLTKSTCPAPDLPLLKFSTLVPSGGFEDKLQSERH
ncbi:uncharacterized protein zgc:66455 [Electrophorus electricus]|uniref:uncharacterized protein zgc:66455 n=1 Tax=Electrophorus electricus TaxID=8005 RepID=UPI0015CFBA7E|nr:uncharacterized protein zgc:66455 [Electrophorus electricus]